MIAERPVWAAILFPVSRTVEGGATVFVGAFRGSSRLHWTREAAMREAESWLPGYQVTWREIDAVMSAADATHPTRPGYSAVVRSILPPLAELPLASTT